MKAEKNRRFHVKTLRVGENPLDATQSRHARDVLRLSDGAAVELFDDSGASARGRLVFSATGVGVFIDSLNEPTDDPSPVEWTIAAAVPKGERADWMVEKLSELGAAAFIPLAAERSVVLPEGAGKIGRWERLAVESAKQSRRSGVMRILPLTSVEQLIAAKDWTHGWCASTEPGSIDAADAIDALPIDEEPTTRLTAFIGPEGGWTPRELQRFAEAGLTAVRLTTTILRIETAAVAIAAVTACLLAGRRMKRCSDSSTSPV